ncbi:MAG TPA: S9 family peptidase [Deltaproteobacteria bacterium]|nr:S9 family peptidase [Deltaproteobacteria bacterium]
MKTVRPCGSWVSPISSTDLVRGALRLSAPRVEGGHVFWLEGRPAEGGRQLVMMGDLSESVGLRNLREASPPGVQVRSRVHEYGGGEFVVWQDRLFFVDDLGGRIHAGRVGGASAAISPAGSRFADLVVSPDGRHLVAVEEKPRSGGEPENRLVAIELGSASGFPVVAGPPRVVAAGHDFYSSPVFAPDGRRLAFLAWDHPDMPWNGTTLEVMAWGASGPVGAPRAIAGGRGESLFQPGFGITGELFVVSDRSGWWNLMRATGAGLVPVRSEAAEYGRPQWVFGMSTWAFLDRETILASATCAGRDRLVRMAVRDGSVMAGAGATISSVGGVAADAGWAAFIAGSPSAETALHVWHPQSHGLHRVRESGALTMSDSTISRAEARTFPMPDGRTTHAFVYPPMSAVNRPREGERSPLIVKTHGGPTAATSDVLDPRIQFWTSRGFSVADVNHAGSSGYGRAYRDQLEGAWGILDVADCVAVARALADEGRVDPRRLAISGGSAGGFTTLCALTFHDLFSAGASHYGIGDLEALAQDTHKFEAHYTDWLVGPFPEAIDRYRARSPVRHADRLACPVIFFQGLEDRVVPPSQAEAMVGVLAARGIPYAYVPFEGEQHGFRRGENIRTVLDGELYFYARIFGFEAPRPEAVEVVGGAGPT